jgi:hypothetical protein
MVQLQFVSQPYISSKRYNHVPLCLVEILRGKVSSSGFNKYRKRFLTNIENHMSSIHTLFYFLLSLSRAICKRNKWPKLLPTTVMFTRKLLKIPGKIVDKVARKLSPFRSNMTVVDDFSHLFGSLLDSDTL